MGVAVITSTSVGRSSLALQLHALMHAEAMLFVHDAKPRSRNATSSENSAWVPTRISISPCASAFSVSSRVRARVRGPSAAPCECPRPSPTAQARHMLAHQDFRRRHQRALQCPLRPRASSASNATMVLPDPTSPCSSRNMRVGLRHVRFDFAKRCDLRLGQREGQGGNRFGFEFARAFDARVLWVRAIARGSAAAPIGWQAIRHRPGASEPASSVPDRHRIAVHAPPAARHEMTASLRFS